MKYFKQMQKKLRTLRKIRALSYWELICIVALVLFNFFIRLQMIYKAPHFAPTYGNVMVHVARAKMILETGWWPDEELAFAGGVPVYYVPLFPVILAVFSRLTGIGLITSSEIITITFGSLLGFFFYLFVKQLTKNWYAGIASGAFVSILPESMIWTTRPLPQTFAMLIIPLALYFVYRKKIIPALITTLSVAMLHPESIFVLSAVIITFCIANSIKKRRLDYLTLAVALVGAGAYGLWHIKVTGLNCLMLQCLPQIASKEYGGPVNLLKYFSSFPEILALPSLFLLMISKKLDFRAKALMLSWFIVTLLLVKNDLLGFDVFTQRFISFMDQAAAVLCGAFVGSLLVLKDNEWINFVRMRLKQKTTRF